MARPKLTVNLEEIAKLASIGATQREMAHWFGISVASMERRMAEPMIRDAYEKARSHFHMSLRRKQTELAMSGNATMLIWLGKNELGQKDQIDQVHSGNVGITHATESLLSRLDTTVTEIKSREADTAIEA